MDDYPSDDFYAKSQNVTEDHYRELSDFLLNDENMKKVTKQSLKHGLYAGGGAFTGAMLMGPVGGMVGGVAGSVIGMLQSDPYDGVVQNILKLESTRKARLLEAVKASLIDAGAKSPSSFQSAEAFRNTLTEYASTKAVRDEIWKACLEAVKQ